MQKATKVYHVAEGTMLYSMGYPPSSVGKDSNCNAGDPG